MNLMLTAIGYPWTVIPVEGRDLHDRARDGERGAGDIGPFTDSLAGLVEGQGRDIAPAAVRPYLDLLEHLFRVRQRPWHENLRKAAGQARQGLPGATPEGGSPRRPRTRSPAASVGRGSADHSDHGLKS